MKKSAIKGLFKTSWLSALKIHIKTKHPLEYVCGHCNMTFTRYSNCERNSKNLHADVEQLIRFQYDQNDNISDEQTENINNIESQVVSNCDPPEKVLVAPN